MEENYCCWHNGFKIIESSKNKKWQSFTARNTNIKPGWKINTVDALITNFHTPRTTLLLILHALIGESITNNL